MTIENEIFIVALLIFMWLISAWAALSQLTRGRARKLESSRRKLAEEAEDWIDSRMEYEIVFRFLSFFTVAILGTLTFAILEKIWRVWPLYKISVVSGLITFLLVALAEILSRALVFRFDIPLLAVTMPLVKFLRFTILFPLVNVINIIYDKLEKRRIETDNMVLVSAEDEIMSLIEREDGGEGGPSPLEDDERRMIRGVLDLDRTLVRGIMTPRVDVEAISIASTVQDAIAKFVQSAHSRIPVYGNSIDEIKGVLLAKDFLDVARISSRPLEQLAHRPIFIPETKAVGDLLHEFRKNQNHFAVVIDEYGGTAGIVTLEDVVEEIVGEIKDEYDTDEDSPPLHARLSVDEMEFHGRTLILHVNEALGTEIPADEGADTIGGYVCAQAGRIPETGEEIILAGGVRATVMKSDRRRILKVKIKLLKDRNE